MATDPNSIAALPPGIDPSEWLRVQRQMALAQALQGMSMTPAQADLQQPAGGGKYYQAARVGPVLGLSKIAEALMAKKGFKKAIPAMAEQYAQGAQAFAPGNQIVPTGQSVITSGPQGAPEGPVPAPRTPTYTQTPSNPLNPQGLPPSVMMRLYQADPAKYAAAISGPENVQTGRLAGMDTQSAAQAVFNKQNALDLRSGGMVRLPNGQIIRAPNLPPGYEPEFDAQGNLVGTHPSPGLIAGEAEKAGKVTAAEVGNKPMEVDMGGGVKRLMYPGDVLPPAPANRAPPSNSPSAPQYFKQPPASGPMPQPPPSARAAPEPGQGMWSSIPKLSIPSTPGQTTDVFHQQILKDAAAKHEELVNKYGSEADLADARIAFNKEAMAVLSGAETGPLSDELTKLRAKALELHIPASWIPGSDTVASTQELKKFALRNPLLNLKPTFGGRPAASEFNVLKEEASPSPTMMKPVFARLVALDTQQAEYTKQKAEDYGNYISKGGDPMRFETWYARRKPLADYFAQKSTPAAALERLHKNPTLLGDFKEKFGWDPTQ